MISPSPLHFSSSDFYPYFKEGKNTCVQSNLKGPYMNFTSDYSYKNGCPHPALYSTCKVLHGSHFTESDFEVDSRSLALCFLCSEASQCREVSVPMDSILGSLLHRSSAELEYCKLLISFPGHKCPLGQKGGYNTWGSTGLSIGGVRAGWTPLMLKDSDLGGRLGSEILLATL